MRWESLRPSTNVEDRRGVRMGRGAALGGGGLLMAVLVAVLGGPEALQEYLGNQQTSPGAEGTQPVDPAQAPLVKFSAAILGSTEDVWSEVLGGRYQKPALSLFSEATNSACGTQSSAVGPFYCPLDRKLYLDLTFFGELDRRFGAPGDFAQAYVIAHEVGHHVQTLMGISEKTQRARASSDRAAANAISVRQELQADCFSGIWAHHARKKNPDLMEPGDVEEGLRAASAIGDDTIQKRSRGHTVPESFTHGTSAQRMHWFRVGYDGGDVKACDTFANERP